MKVRTSAISNQALGPTMVVVHCNPNSLSRYCGHLIFVYLLLLLLLLVLLFPLVLLSEMHYRSPRHRHRRCRRRRRSMVRLWLELGVINLSQHYHYLPTTYLSLHCLPSNHHALNEPVPHLTQLHKTQQPPNHSQPAINPTHPFTHPCNHFSPSIVIVIVLSACFDRCSRMHDRQLRSRLRCRDNVKVRPHEITLTRRCNIIRCLACLLDRSIICDI